MEAQYEKFLDMIRAVRINVPLVDVLARMPNYGKFLKELISNKNEIEQIYVTYLSDESSTMIQNKVPPKLRDLGSFLISCNFNKTFSRNALANLGASINLMPYFLYAKLSLETLKPTKMSVRLVDRSFQYPVGIAENMLVKVGKFTFPADFVILEIEEDSKVPLIWDDLFFTLLMQLFKLKRNNSILDIDVIDEILEEDFDAILDEGSKILHSIEGILLEEEIFAEFDEFIAMITDETSESESNTEEPPFKKITINANYKIKTSLKEPLMYLELKPLLDNLEYVFLEEPSFLLVIISFKLSTQNKSKGISVLKKHKEAFAWKTTNMPGICSSNYKHMIQLLDDKKPVVQKQRSLWVSPIHCVPKKGGITVVTNKNNELVPTRIVTGWRVCIDYRKLNEATAKDHFPLLFMDQMLEILAGNKYLYFLDGFSGYFQIPIDHMDQEKTTFTCPFRTYAYSLDKKLQHCKDAHLVLNWEKCHFMVKEGIVLGHKVSSAGLEADKAKINIILKLPPLLISKAAKKVKFLIVAIDYFTKWLEAKPLTRITGKEVEGIEGPARAAEMVGPDGVETGDHHRGKFTNAIKLFNFYLPQSYKKILSLFEPFSVLLLGNDKFRVLFRKLFLKLLNLNNHLGGFQTFAACQLELMPPTKVKPCSFKDDGVGQGIAFLLSGRKSKMNHHLLTPHQRVDPTSSEKHPLRFISGIIRRNENNFNFSSWNKMDDQGEDENGVGDHRFEHPRNPKDSKVITRWA
nr:reverse transcriptase domain-containing protein [Tanacetum cinerariifolium]